MHPFLKGAKSRRAQQADFIRHHNPRYLEQAERSALVGGRWAPYLVTQRANVGAMTYAQAQQEAARAAGRASTLANARGTARSTGVPIYVSSLRMLLLPDGRQFQIPPPETTFGSDLARRDPSRSGWWIVRFGTTGDLTEYVHAMDYAERPPNRSTPSRDVPNRIVRRPPSNPPPPPTVPPPVRTPPPPVVTVPPPPPVVTVPPPPPVVTVPPPPPVVTVPPPPPVVTVPPPHGCGGPTEYDWVTGTDGSAGTGRPTCFPEVEDCVAKPARCDCHVIGATTLANPADTDPPGPIATTAFATLTMDSGDSPLFVPYYIFVNAFQIGAAPNSSITGLPVSVLLQDSTSGREPNLRRASPLDPQFGICTFVYGEQKEIECVDWRPFASVNNQQLSLTFYNPQDFSVHVCVDMWGLPAAAA